MSDKKKKLWSGEVTKTEGAMEIPHGLFTSSSKEIAQGLKKIVMERKDLEDSRRYESAMSMLDFYINRAGKNLTDSDKDRLEKAKDELKKLFGR